MKEILLNSSMLIMFDLATFIVGMLITIVLCFIAFILYSIKQCLDEDVETEVKVIPVNFDNEEYEEFDP